jgi:hypothetical protein
MKDLIRKTVLVGLLAVSAWYLWSQRDRVESLSNNNLKIQGDWQRVQMEFKEGPVYTFTETFISVDGEEWASYRLLRGSRIEITTAGDFTIYELSFPDDDNMVWSTRTDDKVVPAIRWRR